MREIPVDEAVGAVLGHDLTQVIPGRFKGVRFPKGHRIREEDLAVLKAMGKEHVYILEVPAGMVHEQEAAVQVAEGIAGPGITLDLPAEGKVNLRAASDGLLVLETEAITAVNLRGDVAVVTRPDRRPVRKGDKVASVKIIPLLAPEGKVKAAASSGPLVAVKPFRPLKTWLITTGREVYSGKVEDAFRPRVERKLAPFRAPLLGQTILPDDREAIAAAIRRVLEGGEVELLLVTGGMSVDPDDRTPAAIRQAGVTILLQGAPILPGSMFLLGIKGGVPVLGLPACVIADPVTIFDVVLPRVLAGEIPSFEDLGRLGVGGLLVPEEGLAWDR